MSVGIDAQIFRRLALGIGPDRLALVYGMPISSSIYSERLARDLA